MFALIIDCDAGTSTTPLQVAEQHVTILKCELARCPQCHFVGRETQLCHQNGQLHASMIDENTIVQMVWNKCKAAAIRQKAIWRNELIHNAT
jgi:hypothetical protein